MSKEFNKTKSNSISVADYISQQMNLSGKLQTDIAEEIGLDKPNVISMIKNGKTKIPLRKISKLAKAVGVDPKHLFRLCMREYSPDTADAIDEIFHHQILSANEMEIIEIIRQANPTDPGIHTSDDRERLETFAKRLRNNNEAKQAHIPDARAKQ